MLLSCQHRDAITVLPFSSAVKPSYKDSHNNNNNDGESQSAQFISNLWKQQPLKRQHLLKPLVWKFHQETVHLYQYISAGCHLVVTIWKSLIKQPDVTVNLRKCILKTSLVHKYIERMLHKYPAWKHCVHGYKRHDRMNKTMSNLWPFIQDLLPDVLMLLQESFLSFTLCIFQLQHHTH